MVVCSYSSFYTDFRGDVMKLFLLMLFFPVSVYAFCFEEAAKYYNVDIDLMYAIAEQESSMDPHAYNENKNKHGVVVSRDYGLMQINSEWFDKFESFGISSDMIINEPCSNVTAGAWILSTNFAHYGYSWNSVGIYNAGPKKSRQHLRDHYISLVKPRYYKRKRGE